MIAETAEMLFVTTASRDRGAAAGIQPDQAAEAALQCLLSRRQELSQHPAARGSSLSAAAEASRRQDDQGRLFRALRQRRRGEPHAQHVAARLPAALLFGFGVRQSRTRPCLLFQIKRCSAPCVGRIDRGRLSRAGARGGSCSSTARAARCRTSWSTEMTKASEALDFERAARLRDRAARDEPHPVHAGHQSVHLRRSRSCSPLHSEGGETCIQVFFFRAGQNWGNRPYFPRHAARPADWPKCWKPSSASSTTSAPRRR